MKNYKLVWERDGRKVASVASYNKESAEGRRQKLAGTNFGDAEIVEVAIGESPEAVEARLNGTELKPRPTVGRMAVTSPNLTVRFLDDTPFTKFQGHWPSVDN